MTTSWTTNVQGVSNLILWIPETLKWSISDFNLVKPTCVWGMEIFLKNGKRQQFYLCLSNAFWFFWIRICYAYFQWNNHFKVKHPVVRTAWCKNLQPPVKRYCIKCHFEIASLSLSVLSTLQKTVWFSEISSISYGHWSFSKILSGF